MTDADTQRLLGALESQNRDRAEAMASLRVEMNGLRIEVAALNNKLAGLEGGRKALWGLMIAAATLGGLLVSLLQYFLPR